MYSLELLLTITLATAVIALIAGFLLSQRSGSPKQAQRQLENHLSELQQQQQDYQHEVTEHFSQTAELLNQLTASYKDVHTHLAKGAQLLSNDQGSLSLHALSDEQPSENALEVDEESLSAPLDYAPKTAPHSPGMLNEEFGIEKSLSEVDDEANTTAS